MSFGSTIRTSERFLPLSSSHRGWITHEAAIALINERCTCTKNNEDDDDFQTIEMDSSVEETPVLPELVPLQVVPTFQVGWVTRLSFGEATDSFIIDVSSSGRDSSSIQPRSFCGAWLSKGNPLVSSSL